MNELTLDIIEKIINNCKDDGVFLSNINESKDMSVSYWDINVYKPKTSEFTNYQLIETEVENEYESYTEYHISTEETTDILENFEFAINPECEGYNLDDWLNEYDKDLETNEEVIELVEKYAGKELRIEDKEN